MVLSTYNTCPSQVDHASITYGHVEPSAQINKLNMHVLVTKAPILMDAYVHVALLGV